MLRRICFSLTCFLFFSFFSIRISAQQPDSTQKDTFFLAKKKGLLGRIGKSMSVEPQGPDPVKTANPYLIHTGKIIRSIQLVRLGFDRNIYDTNIIRTSFGMHVVMALHRITRAKVITNDLFFKEGEKIHPYLLADNERFLREQPYFQDARILIERVQGSIDSVDVIVFTKDVFSIGGGLDVGGLDNFNVQLKEENFNGNGNRILLT